ncbi:MAG: SprB repeat-containing protein [Sporocytophaga sp.]|nr:SprB repeat-containing protein [Sporocytophaga sp.]
MALTAAVTNPDCNGAANGVINITSVTGGTAPYTYTRNGAPATQNNINLAAGTHNIRVTDANGCFKDSSFTLTQPAAMALTATVTNPDCNGAANGVINITSVTGGTAPYTYNRNGATYTQNNINLAAGTYKIRVTDANGCFKNFFTLTQPAAMALNCCSY